MPRLGSCRTISTNGSEVTTRNGRIKAAGVSASRRCKHSLTPSPLRGKKRSLPDHHQQRTGHLQKGTVCKIKYKLLQLSIGVELCSCREAQFLKKPSSPANAIALTSHGGARSGLSIKAGSSRSAWSSSMRPGRRRKWRPSGEGRRAEQGSWPKFRTAIGKP